MDTDGHRFPDAETRRRGDAKRIGLDVWKKFELTGFSEFYRDLMPAFLNHISQLSYTPVLPGVNH